MLVLYISYYLIMKFRSYFLLVALIVLSTSTTEGEDIDSDVQGISDFLLEIIEKYDVSGSGAIPINKYPSFLSDVFIAGNALSTNYVQINDPVKQLLLEATSGFSNKYNKTQVQIQQFYVDLVKDFTLYLTENQEKYSTLIDIFFDDTPITTKATQASEAKGDQSVQL